MAYTSDNVRVLRTGTWYVAPTGTTAPTDATTALNAAFVDLGGVGEDGTTEERERDTEQIRYDNGDLAREVVTESNFTLNATLIETTRAGLELYYGATGTVVATDQLQINVDPGSTGGRKSFVFQVVDGLYIVRTYSPEGEITEVGELVFVNDEPWGYEITVTGYKPSGQTYSAQKFYEGLTLA